MAVGRSLAPAALLLLALGPASSLRADPALEDYDEANELYSDFWESIIGAVDTRYDEYVARAQGLLGAGDPSSYAAAEKDLRAAVALAPRKALAHYYLGKVQEAQRNFAGCAASLGDAFALVPTFAPPGDASGPSWQLPYELGLCRARSGDFAGAEEMYLRVLSRSEDRLDEVRWRLGETWMALGRIGEAIEILREVQTKSSHAAYRFTLAVALDRDERLAESAQLIESALARDPQLSSLLSAERVFTPAEDEHYYLTLAYAGAGQRARGLYHMRRYLALAPDSPWTARAQSHIDELERDKIGDDLSISGSASLDRAKTERAVGARAGALKECFARAPFLVTELSITQLSRGTRDGDSRVRPGIRVVVLEQAELSSDELRMAVECAETEAAGISLPSPSGPAGTYAMVRFSLIRR